MDVVCSTLKKLQIDTLILSCDQYSDLWDGFFFQFEKFYPRRGKVFFGCNELTPSNFFGREVSVIHSGKDIGWESSFRNILNQIDSEYLQITLEDLYLSSPVNEAVLNEVENLIEAGIKVNHVKCTNTIKGRKQVGTYLSEIEQRTPYRVTLCGIWNREYLLNLLREGESPWDFEVYGSSRSKNDDGFYAINTSILSNINMVEKGLWITSALKWAVKNQIPVTPYSRKSKTQFQEIVSIMRNTYFNLMIRAPLAFRMKIYLFVKKYLIIH
jgi:hypothetical protein